MDEKTVVIQEFAPEHLDAVVQLHQECFSAETNFAIRLGPRFLRATYKFFLTDSLAFGFVATVAGVPAGFILGRLDYYTLALNRYRRGAYLRALVRHPSVLFSWRFFKRSFRVLLALLRNRWIGHQNLERAPSHTQGKTATLASLGSLPEYAHYRVSDHLVAAAEQYCRDKGMARLRTGVRPDNVPSRFLFRNRAYLQDDVLSSSESLFYYLPLTNA